MTTALLDLAGVLLLGLIGALAVASIQTLPPPPLVEATLEKLGVGEMSSFQALTFLAVTAAVLLLSKSIFATVLLRRVFRFLAAQQALVAERLSRILFTQPLTFIQQRSSQATSYALVQGTSAATLLVLGQAVVIASETALLVALGTALLVISPAIALASIAFFVMVGAALQYVTGHKAAALGREIAQVDLASLNTIQEIVQAYREVTVSNRRAYYISKITEQRSFAATMTADLQFTFAMPKYVFEIALVTGGFVLGAVLFGTQDVTIAVGALTLFLAAGTRVMPSILRLQGAAVGLRNAAGLASSTFELAESLQQRVITLSTPEDVKEAELGLRAPEITQSSASCQGIIRVHRVSYTYPNAAQAAICDVSIDAPAGSSLALVGKSGAGKSTLADLILGVLSPDSGSVSIDGKRPQDLIRLHPGSLSYVPQEVIIANGSIRSNVAFGIPGDVIDDQRVWDVLEMAHLADVIRELGEGLDHKVGEHGLRLSGGQRQRLGIARALYVQPQVLVLDEATSSLDAETELAISQTIGDMAGLITTIYIAHRLSTVRSVNQVVYLAQGRVLAAGSFDELRRELPAFERQASLMGLT